MQPECDAATSAPAERSAARCSLLPEFLADALDELTRGAADETTAQFFAAHPRALEQLGELAQRLVRLEPIERDFEAALGQAKLDAMKELAYGAGHELNNPLANISTRAQVLLRDETDPERRRKLAAINAQAFRGHEMIADLMLFARPPRLAIEAVDPRRLVDRVTSELQSMAEHYDAQLVASYEGAASSLQADPTQLAVALAALVKNALEVVGPGGQVTVEVRTVEHRADLPCAVEIAVRDNGPGIEPEVRAHLFDPFYSGREAGRGLGFGLSKAWRILTLHGGSLDVESQLGHGATFTLRLPAGRASDEQQPDASTHLL